MKRILLLFSALMLSCIALWAHDVWIGGIYYNLDKTNKTAEVTYRGDSYNECSGSVTIPETITYNSEIYSVTSIGNGAFYGYSGLTSITIPNSVTSIGRSAFESCYGLTSVTIPNSVTSIGSSAFYHCSGLTKVNYLGTVDKWVEIDFEGGYASNPTTYAKYLYINNKLLTDVKITTADSIKDDAFYSCQSIKTVEIGNSVTSIGGSAFRYCDKLTSVSIGESVTSIGQYAFSDCSGLTSVTIPNSVTSIGWSAFYGCSGLTSVTIPNSVTSIGSSAFSGCSRLTSVTIPNGVTFIGSYAFSGCSRLTEVIWNAKNCEDFSSSEYSPFYDISSNITSFTFGNEVEHIPANLCYGMSKLSDYGMSKLTEITIPNSVTSIGDSAFYRCSGLTSVTIGESVTSIGSSAFYQCFGLTSITIPNSVTSIGSSAFSSCYYLTSVSIGESVTSIGGSAFRYCNKLTSVTIPNSVTSIGPSAFESCYGLTSVTIGESVTSIGGNAFRYCDKLTSVIWNAKNCEDFSFTYSPFYDIRSSITSFTFGNEVEHIPAYLCSGMSKLTEITIPNSVTSIGSSAFSSCSGLTSVTIGNSVTSIGSYAFSGCSGLTEVTIPNSVTSIGSSAFSSCSGLISVAIPNSVTSIGENAFSGCSGLTSVIWNAKNCEDFKYDSLYGTSTAPFYNIRSNITSFTFGNEVEHIPAYLCCGMSKLTKMTIPNSVTSIGRSAFSSCSGLTSVIWNAKNCEDFSSSTYSPFYDTSSSITSFTFGNEVEHIPAYLCYGMKNLKEVTIGKSVTSIGDDAFYNCSGLTSVTIPNSVTSIGKYAFKSCSGLTKVIWNAKNCEDFSSSTYSPFYDTSSSITSFTFGNEVEHIPAYLCYYMNNLKEVTIGKSVTSIGQHAFFDCSGLTKVNYLGTVDKWVGLDWNHVNSNPTYYAKDLYINNELLTDVKITSADSIKGCAFINCQSIKSVEIGESVTSIGSAAFSGCSGLTKVNYLGTVDKWVEIDFKSSDSNPTYYAKDLYINNELLTDVKITTADSIKNYAFYNCQSIKSVEIGESVTSIGSSAFSGCDKLRKVTAYPTTVPNAYESSFAHYNAYLYVPCDVYEDYDLDDVFGNFKYIKCIAAEEVDAPEKIEIEVDEDNNANVVWPSTDGAKKYELEISKNGEVFCTLLFNENGQLTSIDFGNRSASVGFQFTVTGLDGASKYAYSMVAMDKKGNELQSYKGTFTTNGYVPGPGEEDEPTSITETLADANITVSGGTISADADFSIYNTIGQDVTVFNGSLQPGVYLVSIENNIVKVMVK